MKKLLMLFSVVLIGITLSGCDLIPEDVDIDQISEDFCRDNPTSEICEGDLIENLGDQAILDLFNIIVADFLDDTNENFCDDYFSVTNIELLDSCRTSRDDLLPLDFENFTVLGAEKMPTVSTQNIYEIKAASDDGLTEVVFTIGVVNVDESMYVSTWSYEIIQVDPTTLTVPQEEAQAYFEQFLLDYVDSEITDEAFCDMYFPDDEDCEMNRYLVFDENISFVLNSTADLGDGVYNFEVSIDSDYELPSVDYVDVTFRYDSLGNIVMEFDDKTGEPEDDIDFAEAEMFIIALVDDFNNYDLPSDEVCGIYFEGYEIDECMLHRAEMQSQGVEIELTNFYEDDKGYVIEFTYTIGSEVFDEEIINAFFYYNEEDELKVSFMDNNSNETISLELAEEELVFLLEVFTDSGVPTEEFCEMFFPGLDNANCFLDRESIIMYDLYFEIVEIINLGGYFEAIITIEIPALGMANDYQIGMYFYYDNDHNLYMDVWELFGYTEYLDYEDAIVVFQELINDLNNPAVSWEYINELYFGNSSDDGQAEQRLIDLAEGYYVTFINSTQHDMSPEAYFEVEIEEYIDGEFIAQTIWIRIQILGNGKYFLESDLGQYEEPDYTYNEAYDLLQFFYEEYYWDFMPSDEFCVIFFEGAELDECIEYRDNPERDLGMANLIGLYQLYDGWLIELEVEFLSGVTEYYIIDVDFYFDAFGELKMTFKDINQIIIDDEEAFILISEFFVGMYDETISDEEYCLMFEYYIYDCLNDRPQIMEDAQVWIADFWHEELNRYGLLIAGEDLNGNGYDEIIQYVEFYYDVDDVLRFEFVGFDDQYPDPDYTLLNFEDSMDLYLAYIEDYFNPSITIEELADMYFYGYITPEFMDQRNYDLDSVVDYYIESIYDPMGADGQEMLVATLVVTRDGDPEVIMNNFRVLLLDNGAIIIDNQYSFFIEDPIVEDLTFALEIFIADFNDTYISSDEFCTMYYEGPMVDECIIFREDMLINIFSLEFYNLFQQEDGLFMLDVDVNFEGEFIYNIVFDVVVLPTVDGYEFEVILISDHTIPEDPMLVETEAMIVDFVFNFTDPDISSVDFCANYTDYPVECELLRDDLLSRGMIDVYIIDLYITDNPEYPGELMLRLEYEFNDGTYEEHLFIVIPYHSYIDQTLRFDLFLVEWDSPIPMELFPMSEVEAIYNIFVQEYNDLTNSDEYICGAYSFLLDPELYCYEGRTESLIAGFYLVVDSIELLNDPIYGDYYNVIIAETDGESTFFLSYSLYVYINEYGELVFQHVWETYPE